MSPDRNRALALVILVLSLAVAGGVYAYRRTLPPAAPVAVVKPVAPVKPKPPAPTWRPKTIVVGTPSTTAKTDLALLPHHRIVAYYGHPKATRMGILGQLPPEEMLPKLVEAATEWAKASPGHPVLPALHVVVTVAQEKPGRDRKYRLRHPDEIIDEVIGWAAPRGWIVFLDVQIGHSTIADELPRLARYMERPDVHLALDPEFAMKPGIVPGDRIGTLDAADVNHAIQWLAGIAEEHNLPPKVLVVHRFTRGMLTNAKKIQLNPRVQVVMDMDGFGSPVLKEDAYKSFIAEELVQFTGFKLFYKKDRPLMTPTEVLGLLPAPAYIQYQ